MIDECRYCHSKRVVPVLDKRIERSPKAGNKYRTRCLSCQRWLPMTSESAFKNHANPHVLPADADPDEDGSAIPLEEYDYQDEWEDLAEQAGVGGGAVATDGGEDVEEAGDDRDDRDEDGDQDGSDDVEQGGDDVEQEEEPDNRFKCPATGCSAVNDGYPDECPECGASYDW